MFESTSREPRGSAPRGATVDGARPTESAGADRWFEVLLALGVPIVGREESDESEPACEPAPPSWPDTVVNPTLGPVWWLTELEASGRLMTELESLPADLVSDEREQLELVAHWDRLEAHCAAQKRAAAATLARRQSMAAGLAHLTDLGMVVTDPSIAADEIGARLGTTRRAAARLIESGRAMAGSGVLTAEALERGEIDARKADLILAAIGDLAAETALEVQERVLARAGHLPAHRVQRELAAARAEIDAEHAEERCDRATQTRRVCRPQALPDGMASVYVVLPAVDAWGLFRALDGAARNGKAEGDPRTMDQLRADALAAMGSAALATGWIGPAPENAVAATGPPGEQRRIPRTRGSARRRTRARQLARPSGRRVAGSPSPLRAPPIGSEAVRGRSEPEDGPVGVRVGAIGGRSAHVRVVVPLSTLMGGADGPGADLPEASAPAHLEGYGPIPASVARAVAAGGTWARLVLDPVSGQVRDLTSPRYRPPPSMADLARAEKPECCYPGCSITADACDLNHAIPWPLGATAVDNLDPLCRRHHLLVTHAGWAYESARPDTSDRTGTTALRQRITEHPDGTIAHGARRGGSEPPPPF